MPDRRHHSAVNSRRGVIQPRGPASTMMAGNSVIAARKATPTPTADDTPTVENTPILAKLMPRNVIPMVAADAVITLPTEFSACRTASPESSPRRM